MDKKYTSKDEKFAEANYIAFLGFDYKGNTVGNYLGFSNPKVGAIYIVAPFLNMSAQSIEQNLRAAESASFGFFAKKNLSEFLKRMDEHLDKSETGFRVDYKTRLQAAKDTVAELYPELLKGMEEKQAITMKAARPEIESVLDLYRASLAVTKSQQEQKELLHRFTNPILTPELEKAIESVEKAEYDETKSVVNGHFHKSEQANAVKYVPGTPEDKKPTGDIKFPFKIDVKPEFTVKMNIKDDPYMIDIDPKKIEEIRKLVEELGIVPVGFNGDIIPQTAAERKALWEKIQAIKPTEKESAEKLQRLLGITPASKIIATFKGNHEDLGEEDSDADGKK